MLQNIENLGSQVKSNSSTRVLKYHVETYGCQMNVYDSEIVSSMLEKSGYVKTEDIYSADAIFLNTCSVREKAEETVHNRLINFKGLKRRKPHLLLGVLGCMAQNLKDSILESKPYVDVILGPDSYRRLPDIIKSREMIKDHFVDTKLSKFEVYEDMFPSRKEGVNAWISIMRGCDKFCTFCIVPFTRGRERSRSIQSILNEAKNAVEKGFLEITLLGQNVNSFNSPEGRFPELLDQLAAINGVKRIRYTSPHPQDINDDLLKVMSSHDNICNYIHLPLQSGSDRILSRMNRTYTKKQYLELAEKIRFYMPDCSISTDLIVGFPGETDSDFKDTLDVMNIVKFNSSYKFKYSSRPGTKAAEFSDQVEEIVKQKRLDEVIELQKTITLDINSTYLNKVVKVLIEKNSKKSDSQWSGRTEGNTWVVFDKKNEKIKDFVDVKISGTKGVTLFGDII